MIVLGDIIGLVHAQKLDYQPVERVSGFGLCVNGEEEGNEEGGRTEEHELLITSQATCRVRHSVLTGGAREGRIMTDSPRSVVV